MEKSLNVSKYMLAENDYLNMQAVQLYRLLICDSLNFVEHLMDE